MLRPCWSTTPIQAMKRLTRPCRRLCAAAVPTSACEQPSTARPPAWRQEAEMITQPISPTRRDFIRLAGAGSGGLVLALYLGSCAVPEEATPTAIAATPTAEPAPAFAPNLYIKIDTEGRLTVTAFRLEMGQGIRTAIAMLLADELDMDWESVQIIQADADGRYGNPLTGVSVSISGH